eukprot:s351_g26.t1
MAARRSHGANAGSVKNAREATGLFLLNGLNGLLHTSQLGLGDTYTVVTELQRLGKSPALLHQLRDKTLECFKVAWRRAASGHHRESSEHWMLNILTEVPHSTMLLLLAEIDALHQLLPLLAKFSEGRFLQVMCTARSQPREACPQEPRLKLPRVPSFAALSDASAASRALHASIGERASSGAFGTRSTTSSKAPLPKIRTFGSTNTRGIHPAS